MTDGEKPVTVKLLSLLNNDRNDSYDPPSVILNKTGLAALFYHSDKCGWTLNILQDFKCLVY